MKTAYLLLLSLLPLTGHALETSTNTQDYKCYIGSVKGDQIVFFRWQATELKLKMAGLPGRQLMDNKGKKYFIKAVEECVPLDEEFTLGRAQQLDKATLR
ncbi:TapY2 family type IVa secretion system protein [Shewanella salipaludis]|uniref:Uncharacterized protein n=1 Tax=Shewanella salipaludis TaxID=2723052 RepID=A0A972FWW2_9GAMM|nr:TapY2 family type IVa secretion system protein [Shewanella salipaludis]NMH64738.1 hypothetical protein [Shewanella salipaludis]